MRAGKVYVEEVEEVEEGEWLPEADHVFTGTFAGRFEKARRTVETFEGLTLEQALAWARERADRVEIRIGYGPSYALGFRSDTHRPWPEGGVEPPVRRRPPDQVWRDRTDADPDAPWKARLHLGPPEDGTDERRPEWDETSRAIAEEMEASWSADEFDAHAEAMRAAERRAKRGRQPVAEWGAMHPRAYVLTVVVEAPTCARAEAAVHARIPDLPPGWSASLVHLAFGGAVPGEEDEG